MIIKNTVVRSLAGSLGRHWNGFIMNQSNIIFFLSLRGIYSAWFVFVWSTGQARDFLARYPRAESPLVKNIA